MHIVCEKYLSKHVPRLRQGDCEQSMTRCWHDKPWYSGRHKHWNSSASMRTHEPSFKQGWERHGSKIWKIGLFDAQTLLIFNSFFCHYFYPTLSWSMWIELLFLFCNKYFINIYSINHLYFTQCPGEVFPANTNVFTIFCDNTCSIIEAV